MTLRTASWAAAALLVGAAAPAWGAEGPSGTVYRCPGNPVLYTDQLTPMQAQEKGYNNREPERLGSERNYQKYLDRVAELKAGIARKEADIASIRREIGKLPPQ
jgi:hypothetical protein